MTEVVPERTGNPWLSMEMYDALQRHARAYQSTGILATYLATDPENRDEVGRLVAFRQQYPSFIRYALHELDMDSSAGPRAPFEAIDRQAVVADAKDDGNLVVNPVYTEDQARLVMSKAEEIATILQPYIRR